MADTKPKTARYFSKYRNLTIVVKSAYYKIVEDKRVLVEGNRVAFTDGAFETTDENLIKELEAREDFGNGGAFIRIPENQTTDQMRDAAKIISDKDLEIAKLKAENEALRLKDSEAGNTTTSTTSNSTDDLADLKRDDLVAIAVTLGLEPETYKVGVKNEAIKEAIRARRVDEAAF